MATTSMQPTWGITGPQFLWIYGALCLAAAAFVAWRRLTAGGPAPAGPEPDLGVHDLAMLSGGPQLAITSAATQLMRDGAIKAGAAEATLDVAGELDPDADPLERAVFECLEGKNGTTVEAMRCAVVESDALATMKTELVDAGLLLSDREVRELRWHWLVGAALIAFGLVRLFAGSANEAPFGWLLALGTAVGWSTSRLFHSRPLATRAGTRIVDRWRDSTGELEVHAVSGDRTLTAALFGAAALWFAEPQIASALAVPFDEPTSGSGFWSTGGGGGDGGGGCGGCGGCG